MNLFPFFVDIQGKTALIIGGGRVAERKAKLLLRFGADILILAPETSIEGTFLSDRPEEGGRIGRGRTGEEIRKLKEMIHTAGGICILKKEFEEEDILLGDFVIAATDSREKNAAVAGACRERKIPVNVADDPDLCTFIFPSLIKRGALSVGITTGGSSPSASRLLRERIEEALPEETEEILERMDRIRRKWKSCPSERAKKNANRRALLCLLESANRASDEELEEIMEEERQKNWVIATRGSALALAQAEIVRSLLEAKGIGAELHIVSTKGDRDRVRPLQEIGGNGLFVREVERELLSGRADIAVHSGKDLPACLTEGTVIAGIPEAADRRDCLITLKGGFPAGRARIGTGSPRRIAQLKKLLPDAEAAPIRGNIDTRLQKLREGRYDGILLAKAGLDRLKADLSDFDVRIFSEEELLPAACQGILAVQCREKDPARRSLLAEISDPDTVCRFQAERLILKLLKADCAEPVGVCADTEKGRITIRALYKGRRAQRTGAAADYERLCKEIAEELREGEETNLC